MMENLKQVLIASRRDLPAPSWTTAFVGTIAGVAMLMRGLDYFIGTRVTGVTVLLFVEEFASADRWGIYISVAGLILLLHIPTRRLTPIILSHLLCIFVYTWYGVALGQGIWANAGEGVRFVVPVLASVSLHTFCIYLLGREVRSAATTHLREVG